MAHTPYAGTSSAQQHARTTGLPRRTLVLLVCLAVAVVGILAAMPRRAWATTTEHQNLVVVTRFSDDTTEPLNAAYQYNNSYTYWQQFISWFNSGTNTYFDQTGSSLQAYMTTISNGAWHVTSYFPQTSTDGKTLVYITLPHDKSYYETVGDLQLVSDAADVFNANTSWTASSSSWGTKNVLDNLELVVQVSAEPATTDKLLWPHKSNASGAVSFGGMKVYEYNLVNSKAVSDLGTVKHEYLHTAGLGDLYRVGDTSETAGPVGIWDIMGSAAGQWPLAQSLVDLGFESLDSAIPLVSGAGAHTVTLGTHYLTSGTQAVRVASPYSSDEYFVFEYRQKSTDTTQPDRMVPSSGLIVYRVNDAIAKDTNGHRTNRNKDNGYYEDAIYVFRPGETGIHDSAGNLQKAALSTSGYAYLGDSSNTRTTFGTATMTAGVTDGAIVDASNINSGITVQVTAQTDTTITFNLTIPDYSSLSLWDTVGTAASAGQADGSSVAVGTDGTIYQAYADIDDNTSTTSIKVRSWNGTSWTSLGTVASGSLGHVQLQCVGSTLYCTYASFPGTSNAYCVSTWTGSTTWTQVSSISTGSEYSNAPTSAVLAGSLYMLIDRENASLQLYRLDGTSLTAIGTSPAVDYVTEPALGLVNGKIALVCGDVGSAFADKTGENIYVLGDATPTASSTWTKIYSETTNVSRNVAVASVGTSLLTFVAYDADITPQLRLVASDGKTVTSHAFSSAGTNIQDASMFVANGNVYLTVTDGNGLVTTWYAPSSNLDAWTQLGSATMSNASTSKEALSSLAVNETAYVSAVSSSLTSVTILSHALATATSAEKTKVAIPAVTTSFDFDGSAHTAVAAGTGYTLTGTVTATAVGAYSVTIALADKATTTWSDDTTADQTFQWYIKSVAPGAPTGLTATPGDGTVALSWTAPEFTGGTVISGYQVWRATGSAAATLLTTTTGTSFSDTSVSNGTSYTYSVKAVNSIGVGAASETASATPSAAPAPTEKTKVAAPKLAASSFVYDGSAHTAVAAGTGYTLTGTATATNAGTYTAAAKLANTATTTWSDGTTADKSFTWSITPRPVTVTANNASKSYGAADPTLAATVSGTLGSDRLSYTVTRTSGEGVGSYTITPSGASRQGNYAVAYAAGTFTIARATGNTVSASGWSGQYDGGAHAVSASASAGGSSLWYSTNGSNWQSYSPSWVNVTSGAQTVYVKATNPNFEDSPVVSASVNISRRPVTVTAASAVKTYQTSDPTFSASVSGTLGSDFISYSIGRSQGEGLGNYAITPSGPSTQGNYSVSYVSGTLTIEKWCLDVLGAGSGRTYVISNAKSGLALDVAGASRDIGANVQQWVSNETVAQHWHVRFVSVTGRGSGYYVVTNVGSGKSLDVQWGSTSEGGNIWQYDENGTSAQQWIALGGTSGAYLLNASSLMALDVQWGQTNPGANVQQWGLNWTSAQVWGFRDCEAQGISSGSVYSLVNFVGGMALDVAGASHDGGANVQTWDVNHTPAQRWQLFYDNGTGYYTLVNQASGLVLDLAGGGATSGTNAQQWGSNGTHAQMWSIAGSTGSGYSLTSASGGLALDVSGASPNRGANVQGWEPNGTAAQRWAISAV